MGSWIGGGMCWWVLEEWGLRLRTVGAGPVAISLLVWPGGWWWGSRLSQASWTGAQPELGNFDQII